MKHQDKDRMMKGCELACGGQQAKKLFRLPSNNVSKIDLHGLAFSVFVYMESMAL